jgi:hypothetical protein
MRDSNKHIADLEVKSAQTQQPQNIFPDGSHFYASVQPSQNSQPKSPVQENVSGKFRRRLALVSTVLIVINQSVLLWQNLGVNDRIELLLDHLSQVELVKFKSNQSNQIDRKSQKTQLTLEEMNSKPSDTN